MCYNEPAVLHVGMLCRIIKMRFVLLEATSETMYWTSHNGAITSVDIETTAYALLALLQFDDFASSAKVVTWLTAQRDAIGNWRTTQVRF